MQWRAGLGLDDGRRGRGGAHGVTYACDAPASLEDSLAIRFAPEDLGDAAPGDGECETVVGNMTCTLRAAIDEANALRGRDTITFAIGLGLVTIQPDASLSTPTYVIRDPVVIDAHTQPPGVMSPPLPPTPLIVIDGQYAIDDAIRIESGGSEINGLGIKRYTEDGIEIVTQGCNLLQNNIIGTAPRLDPSVGLGGSAVRIVDTISNTLRQNVLANNDEYGVAIVGTMAMYNLLDRNFIGLVGDLLDPDDVTPLGNGLSGVLIQGGSENKIGDPDDSLRFTGNVISDNGGHGVLIVGAAAISNTVFASYVGTSLRGDDPYGNALDGVRVVDAAGSHVVGNTLADNGGHGVAVAGSSAALATIQDNRIGVSFTGDMALGNALNGVYIDGAPQAKIAGNVIGDNGGHGVEISGAMAAAGQSLQQQGRHQPAGDPGPGQRWRRHPHCRRREYLGVGQRRVGQWRRGRFRRPRHCHQRRGGGHRAGQQPHRHRRRGRHGPGQRPQWRAAGRRYHDGHRRHRCPESQPDQRQRQPRLPQRWLRHRDSRAPRHPTTWW